jgi:hypothetical protein
LLDFAHYNSRNARDLARRAGSAGLPRAEEVIALVEPLDGFVEIAHKVMAAQFAVSEYLEAKILLLLQHLQYVLVFQCAQLLTGTAGATRLEQFGRPQ